MIDRTEYRASIKPIYICSIDSQQKYHGNAIEKE